MPRRLVPGTTVDRYRVELVLGEGGMATVYRVRHQTLDTVHALKVLHTASPALQARLVEEGRVQASLRHPNIVPVTDVLEVDGEPALLMEYISAGVLSGLLSRGPIADIDELRWLFGGILAGVEAAHERGLVHRDLKPANVLLDWPAVEDGPAVPRVTDFGLAKSLFEGPGGPRRTLSGVALGTPAYMAPEQVRDAAHVDQRADIFALGALLHALATGRSPFQAGDRFATLQRVVAGDRSDPRDHRSDLPPALLATIDACLAPQPDARPASCAAVRALLDQDGPGAQPWLAPAGPGPAHADGATWDPDGAGPTPVPASAGPSGSEGATGAPVPPSAPVAPLPTGATGAGLRRAEVVALVVDARGGGHCVPLVVEAWPGGAGVHNPAGADRDAEVAAQLAAAVVLGPAAGAWGVRWAARGHGFQLHGTSLGLAVAVGLQAALAGRPVPPGWAFTGGLDLDGRVASVRGVPAKLRAAAAAGCATVAVPAADAPGLPPVAGVAVVPVGELGALVGVLFPAPAPRRRPPWRWAALLLPLLVALTDAGSPLDLWLQTPLLAGLRGVVPVEDVAVVSIPAQGDLKSLRPRYPELLRRLAAAGVTSVFWDVLLSAPDPADAAIAAAIAEVRAGGMAVALPVRIEGGRAVPPATPALAAAAPLGTIEARQDALFGQIRGVPLSRRPGDGSELWHLAVWTAHGHVRARQPPRLDGDTLVVGPLRNPSWAGELWLAPTGPVPTVDWQDAAGLATLAGRAVVVGVEGGAVDLHRTPQGVRSGAALEAAMVQTLLAQAAPHRVAPELDALAAGLLALVLALLRPLVPRTGARALAAAGVFAAAAGLVAALGLAGRLVAPTPLLVGAAVGLWLAGRRGAPGAAAEGRAAVGSGVGAAR